MIEVVLTYDLVPGADQQAYLAWAKNAIGATMQQPGLIEFRAHRNLLGTPQVRTTTEWQSLADWETFWQGAWQPIEAALRTMATSVRVEFWGPSPVLPEPLHPGK
jgi:heme-degrading monooxygenase HmoA